MTDDDRTFRRLVSFAVVGVAAPKGSTRSWAQTPKGGGRPIIRTVADNDATLGRWTDLVRTAAMRALGITSEDDADPSTLPVYMRLRFTFARPPSHYRADGRLTARAPRFHTQRPDRDKLERAIADALTGLVWRDDSQVIDGRTSKSWGAGGAEHAGVVVDVYAVGEDALAFGLAPAVESRRDERPTRDASAQERGNP